ncbi:MAG: hypothetical protein AB7L66_17185 [Gemmatimonadales bacterium]
MKRNRRVPDWGAAVRVSGAGGQLPGRPLRGRLPDAGREELDGRELDDPREAEGRDDDDDEGRDREALLLLEDGRARELLLLDEGREEDEDDDGREDDDEDDGREDEDDEDGRAGGDSRRLGSDRGRSTDRGVEADGESDPELRRAGAALRSGESGFTDRRPPPKSTDSRPSLRLRSMFGLRSSAGGERRARGRATDEPDGALVPELVLGRPRSLPRSLLFDGRALRGR